MWALLAEDHAFRRLWTAATVDALGTWLLVMAVPVQVYALTGSGTSTATALAVQALPALTLGPLAGALVDRWPRRRVFVAANLFAAAGVALIAAGPVSLIYAGLVVESAAACFLRPALQATVPLIVPTPEGRASANALLAVSHSVLRIGAPLAGTALTAAGFFTTVVAVDAASYLAAAALLARLSTGKSLPHHHTRPPDVDILSLRTPTRNDTPLHAPPLRPNNTSPHIQPFRPDDALLHASFPLPDDGAPLTPIPPPDGEMPPTRAPRRDGVYLQTATPNQARGRVASTFQTSDAAAVVTGALAAPALVALTGATVAPIALSATVLLAAVLIAALLRPKTTPAAGTGVQGDEPHNGQGRTLRPGRADG